MELSQIAGGSESRADLNRLLIRLDPEPERAWEKYRDLRVRLIKFFEWNQCTFPEELADEVLDRVARKPEEESIRNVAEFVIGVARNVRMEAYKKMLRESHVEDWPEGAEALPETRNREEEIVSSLHQQIRLDALRRCLENLKESDRSMALAYYSAEEEKQRVHRQKLATALGLTMVALRVRANRVREKLEQCVTLGMEARRQARTGG